MMNPFLRSFLSCFLIGLMTWSQAQQREEDGVMFIPTTKSIKPVATFFSAHADTIISRHSERLDTVSTVRYDLHQGQGDRLSLSITGQGEVTEVTGDGLLDWSLRRDAQGQRFLDVKVHTADPLRKQWVMQVKSRLLLRAESKSCEVALLGQGNAVGFTTQVTFSSDNNLVPRVIEVENLAAVEKALPLRFVGSGMPKMRVDVSPSDNEVTFRDTRLTGKVAADQHSVSFLFQAKAQVKRVGVAMELFRGAVAMHEATSGDGWHVRLRQDRSDCTFDWIADREGEMKVEIRFEVPVQRINEMLTVDFVVPAGVVASLWLEGLSTRVQFDSQKPVVPSPQEGKWRGFLPADGKACFAWKEGQDMAEGALFFSSAEISDIRVGSGLLRQTSRLDLRVLQGKLPSISLQLHGEGEVLSVQGDQVVGWTIHENQAERILAVQFSGPMTGAGRLSFEFQSPLGNFPTKSEGLRLTPIGSLRHSGWLRIANEGAVKIEVSAAKDLIQLSPEQFPLENQNLRQSFVYRFPSAGYAYQISADHVLPETTVQELTLYELAETDRRIHCDLEIDIREAPLREWEFLVPEDYTVVSCSGASVSDYTLASTKSGEYRTVKILFRDAVRDRQLIQLRLEKNEAAKAGGWKLPRLHFPHAKTHRGFLGIASVPGFRISADERKNLNEVPLSYFPKQWQGLQQAYRMKESSWSAEMKIETLGQSIQADVFHLYSVKEGAVYGSVLFNFFVVGTPSSEWRVKVPESIGNIEITGQNIGHEWRREGDELVVPLSRPLLGAATMLLCFEQPIKAAGGEISPGEIRPVGVQSESGYIQVVSPLQVDFQVTENKGNILPLLVNELPADYRVLSTAPTLSAWQYTAREFSIRMKFQWFPSGETVEQVVDFVQLGSQVSRDGQVVTEAKFFVKSKRREALRMVLPEGAILLETKVNGATANPRVDNSEIVIPLPQKNDLNQAVEVLLRYGSSSSGDSAITLQAPVLQAPTVIGEWKVMGDEGRILTPVGGTAEIVRKPFLPDGFEWLSKHSSSVWMLAALLALAWLLSRRPKYASTLWVLGAIMTGWLSFDSFSHNVSTPSVLEYAAPVVNAGAQMNVILENHGVWRSALTPGFWCLLALSIPLLYRGWQKCDRRFLGAALMSIALALLFLRNGITIFFSVFCLSCLIMCMMRIRDGRMLRPRSSAIALVLISLIFSMTGFSAMAQDGRSEKFPEQLLFSCKIRERRLTGTVQIAVRAEPGDRFALLHAPAVLGEFLSDGLRVVRETRDGESEYVMIADRAGSLSANAQFEMSLPEDQKPWTLPTTSAAVRKLSLRSNQPGWDWSSAAAVRRDPLPDLTENESGALLLLQPTAAIEIVPQPRERDLSKEKSVYFVESSQLFIPLPGVVNGLHSVSVRPSQGQVADLVLRVPSGFTVSDVTDGPVRVWRFEPDRSELRVSFEPALHKAFSFTVHTQQSTPALPLDLKLEPLRVMGAASEVGILALAFGNDAQPDKASVQGLVAVNPEDFPPKMLPCDSQGRPLVTLHQVYRFGAAQALLNVRVAAVAPEMRAESWHVLSLGDDRLVLSTEITVSVTRAGIFRLLLEVPRGLELESASGSSLSHWTEAESEGGRLMTLHLQGRTMGQQQFQLTFTGQSPGNQASWQIPRLAVREATRESGLMVVVPEQGMRLGVVERDRVSPVDPRDLSDAPQAQSRAAMRTGAIAFRLLQKDWKVALSVNELDPWVTAQVYHETTLREGQLNSKVSLSYQIENATMKQIRIRLPGLNDVAAGTLRASGDHVADLRKASGETDVWEIRFQRGVSGSTVVDLEFQQQLNDQQFVSLEPVRVLDARQVAYFSAVRSGGRMELSVDGPLPEGWIAHDWAAIQSSIPKLRTIVSPALSFKVTNPEQALKLSFQRHQLADVQKMRVEQGQLTTLISSRGAALTAVRLQVKVAEKGTLRLRLPNGADLYNVLVNDEGVSLVRQGDEWLFHVFPAADAREPSCVRFVYASTTGDSMKLEGPSLHVPMENLSWQVLIPDGWSLRDYHGDFKWKTESHVGSFRLENYRDYVNARKANSSAEAMELFDQASHWISKGDQEKASIALGNAARNGLLDEASNEDARVQLRELRTQQAVLGLNTRRQKMFLDNKTQSGSNNKQLEQAALANPLLQGKANYDPTQFDRFIEGNTADENAALQGIAQRIVSQQLAVEPAPSGLEITVPERGSMLTFTRSIQVDGGKSMHLQLSLEREQKTSYVLGIMLCALLAWGITLPRLKKLQENTYQPPA